MNARHRLLALWALAQTAAGRELPAAETPGEQKLRALLQQRTPGAPATGADPARRAERAALLQSGEAALARLDVESAERDFDRAALIAHAVDTEMGLVRTYMQSGAYRRALAFGAHTAGAHLDALGGAALYAWLLDAGGQEALAQRLLQQAAERAPGQPLVDGVARALATRAPLATAGLLDPPVRLAPYGAQPQRMAQVDTLGSAVLIDAGRRALAPLASLGQLHRPWVRNGLGQLSAARIERRLLAEQLAVLRLERPLPPGDAPLRLAARDAFPGSVALAVEYVAGHGAAPRWPLLRTGFLGMPREGEALAPLGVALPGGPRGGPVFDAAGRFAGLALRDAAQRDRLLPVSRLHAALGDALGMPAQAPAAGAPAALDQVYEQALRSCLQLVGARQGAASGASSSPSTTSST